MEIVENYSGSQEKYKGYVDFFFRETMFAKYHVLETVRKRFNEMNIPYEYNMHAYFCGGEGQEAYTLLVSKFINER